MDIKYKILTLEEAAFCFKPDYDYSGTDPNHVAFQLSHDLVPNPEKEEIGLTIKAEITPEDSNMVLAGETVYCTFHVSPFDKVIKTAGESFKTSEPALLETFISIGIGALRGLLAKNLKGTPLAGYILPLIPMSFIHRNFISEPKGE